MVAAELGKATGEIMAGTAKDIAVKTFETGVAAVEAGVACCKYVEGKAKDAVEMGGNFVAPVFPEDKQLVACEFIDSTWNYAKYLSLGTLFLPVEYKIPAILCFKAGAAMQIIA